MPSEWSPGFEQSLTKESRIYDVVARGVEAVAVPAHVHPQRR